jgi:NadR type nicotinamide-nucleotide adenylyltransferase
MGKELQKDKILNVVVTGPESTGKSTLAIQLAKHYNTIFIPEYARTFVESLDRPYTYEDIEHIARRQVQDLKEYQSNARNILFLDTYLIITKVWFEVVYQRCPGWLVEAIQYPDISLFLLCSTDIPWEPDPVRENGGEMREKLFHIYQQELEKFGFPYRVITGIGPERLENAIRLVDSYLHVPRLGRDGHKLSI